MFIKCEKCGAIFDIDASFIKPGQPLRCSGCNHVFKYTPTSTLSDTSASPKSEPETLNTDTDIAASGISTQETKSVLSQIQPTFSEKEEPLPPELKTQDTTAPKSASQNAPLLSVPEEFKPVSEQRQSSPLFWIILLLAVLVMLIMAVLFLIPDTLKQSIFLEKEIPQTTPVATPALEVIDTSFRVVPDQQNGLRLLVQGALYNPANQTQPTHSFWIELYDAANTLIYTQEVIPIQKKIMAKSTLPFYTEITPVPDTVKRMDIVFK